MIFSSLHPLLRSLLRRSIRLGRVAGYAVAANQLLSVVRYGLDKKQNISSLLLTRGGNTKELCLSL